MDDPIKGGADIAPASPAPTIPEDATIDEAFDLIETWFSENFEDPVHGVPYNGREGGYLYTYGGPYDAADILHAVYSSRLSGDERAEIVDRLNNETDVWVPSGGRRLPPDEDEADWDQAALEKAAWSGDDPLRANAELHRAVEAAAQTLTAVNEKYGGMGHNNPPTDIDDLPLTSADRDEIGQALSILRSQPIQPTANQFFSIRGALQQLSTLSVKLGSWVAGKGDLAANKFAEEIGKRAAQGVVVLPLWLLLEEHLRAVMTAAGKWLAAVNFPF